MQVVVVTRSVDVASLVTARVADAYRLARAILLDPGEAEEVAQEACLTAWRKQASLRDPERFDAWFDRIVVNLCRDRIRRRARVREIEAAAVGRMERGPTWPGRAPSDLDVDLDRAIDSLDADHRIVVLLRYWRDLTVDEIGVRLGVPAGTVKSRLHYAMHAIRAELEAPHGRS